MTDEKDMALTLRASGFVRGEWTEEDIAAVLAPERDALIAQQAAELERQAGVIAGLRQELTAEAMSDQVRTTQDCHHRQYAFVQEAGPDHQWCERCDEFCSPDGSCYCCLAAEVEALRAQVQRVREVCERYDRVVSGAVSAGNLIPEVRDDLRSALTAALDGGDDE